MKKLSITVEFDFFFREYKAGLFALRMDFSFCHGFPETLWMDLPSNLAPVSPASRVVVIGIQTILKQTQILIKRLWDK